MGKLSLFEMMVMNDLEKRRKSFTFESLKLSFVHKGYYVPDLVLSSGVIVEIKGYFRKLSRDKMVAVKTAHPELDIRFVFQNDKARVQGAKKRKDGTYLSCGEWANSHGFRYSVGSVPEEWFDNE